MEDVVIALMAFNLVLINIKGIEPSKFFAVLWLIVMASTIFKMAGVLNV